MTVPQILEELKPVKPLSRARLYVYLRRFKIKSLGIRQCPQQFPDNAPLIIRMKLGLPMFPAPKNKRGSIRRGANLKRGGAR